MPAHAKSTIVGAELTIPITNGRMNMGIWQEFIFLMNSATVAEEENRRNHYRIISSHEKKAIIIGATSGIGRK